MTLYEFLKSNKEVISVLNKHGIMPTVIAGQLVIYENVLEEQKKGKIPTDSYYEVADKMKLGINTVIRAVGKMREEITPIQKGLKKG